MDSGQKVSIFCKYKFTCILYLLKITRIEEDSQITFMELKLKIFLKKSEVIFFVNFKDENAFANSQDIFLFFFFLKKNYKMDFFKI